MSSDFDKLSASKRAFRGDIASRPVDEKLRMLDAMRERELTLRGSSQAKERSVPPEAWEQKTVGDMVEDVRYGTSAKTSEDADGIPVLRMGNIKDGGLVCDSLKYLPKSHDEFPALLLQDGDLLFNRTNSAELVGKSAVYRGNPSPCSFASYLIRARLKPHYVPEFVAYYINSTYGRAWIRSVVSQQVGQANVNGTKLKALSVPVPSFREQQRIVAEIEKQFTRLEAAVAAMRRVQANLKRYRAAVLKAACEGRLVPTEGELAKAENRKFETGEELLARILAQRRNGSPARGRYKEPVAPDAANLPTDLPEGWGCASVDQITENFDGRRVPLKSADRARRSGAYPYYGASGIIDGIDDFLFDGNYLLIAEDGANLLSRSTPIAFKATGKFWVNNHAHVVQTCGGIPLSYLSTFLNGRDISFSVTGSAQPKLTQAALNRIPVALPPLPEQTRIVAEVERRLSVIDDLEAVVFANFRRVMRLRQSILGCSFSYNKAQVCE